MPRDKRRDAFEAAGLIAIIASLLFLAFEIKQSNRIAVASTEIGIRSGYSEFNRGLYSGNGIAEILTKATELDVEWSSVEELKIQMVMSDIFNVWLSVETACDNGLARASTCAELGDDIRALITMFPGTGNKWRFILESYPGLAGTEVYSTIDRALKD